MNYVPNFFPLYGEDKKQEEERKTGIRLLDMEQIKEREFNSTPLIKKSLLYKMQYYGSDGYLGEVLRCRLVFMEKKNRVQYEYDYNQKSETEFKVDFEYVAFSKNTIYFILKNEDGNMEFFRWTGEGKVAIYVESASVDNRNMIYACYMCDTDSNQFYSVTSMRAETGGAIYNLFESFTVSKEA